MQSNMKSFKYIFIFVFLIISHSLHAGTELHEMPNNISCLFSPEYNIVGSIRHLLNKNIHPEDELIIFAPHFTDTDLARTLVENKVENVQIIIDHSSTQRNHYKAHEVSNIIKNIGHLKLHAFNQKGIKKYGQALQMHIKALLWAHHEENDIISYRVFTGSSNLSEAAKTNQEHLVIYPNDEQRYMWYKAIAYKILDGTLSPEQLLLAHRPELNLLNQNIVSSDCCNLMKSLSSIIKQTTNGDKIYLSSLSFDDTLDIKKALIQAKIQGARIELIIDRNSCTNNKIISQLNEMHKNNILIYNFRKTINENEYDIETKNHSKYILIKKRNDFIVIEGSANLTYHSNFDINQLTIHRNREFYDTFKQYHKALINSYNCTRYSFVRPVQPFKPQHIIYSPNKKRKLIE